MTTEVLEALKSAQTTLSKYGYLLADARSERHRRFAETLIAQAEYAAAVIAKAERCDCQNPSETNGGSISPSQALSILLASIDADGMDLNTFTVAELRRALP